jgi:tetratricopeptide (TPR) repeat protein
MSNSTATPAAPIPSPSGGPAALSPAQRQRLQQLFEHANKTQAQAIKQGVKSNFDYAHDLYGQCVLADPGNVHYVKALLDNLYKKFGDVKKGKFGGWFGGGGGKGTVKKLAGKKDWNAVLKFGVGALKSNVMDADVLLGMADACEHLKLYDAQLIWLRGARRAKGKDASVNRICALALARRGRYDEAMECWKRVKDVHPDDDEADKAIAQLAVDKTIKHGHYDQAESTTDTMADKQAQAERKGEAERVTPEQKFRKLISENPTEVTNYIELADLLTREDRYDEVEQVLNQALSVSGGDMKVREYLEDAQIRRAKHHLKIAEKRAVEDATDEARQLAQRMAAEVNRQELAVYSARAERYPSNVGLKYEVGLRLRRAGNYQEAIKWLQAARNDARRKGLANFELGECFRLIKQYPLALGAYEAALEGLTDKEIEPRKQALYWAGKVALLGTKDLDKAEKHLNALAGLDFGYKDLAALLDKLAELRQN